MSIFRDPSPSAYAKALRRLANFKGDAVAASAYADSQHDFQSAMLLRAAVGAVTTGNASALATTRLASDEFVELLRPQTVLGRLTFARQIPFLTEVARVVGAATSYWVGEAGYESLSAMQTDRTTALEERTVASICVLSQETLRLSGPLGEAMIDTELTAAVAQAIDAAFLSDAAASGARPAGIFYGSGSLSTSGDPETDFANLIDHFHGNLTRAAFLMSSRLAARLNLMRDSGGLSNFRDVGANGGEIAGIRVITTDNMQDDTSGSLIGLVDQSGILIADNGVALSLARHAAITMADNVSAAAAQVSLWQTNSVAARVTRTVNWSRAIDSAVLSMTVSY
jgi:HK97 family phage major capsid protein